MSGESLISGEGWGRCKEEYLAITNSLKTIERVVEYDKRRQ
jgi:hypothetical protein